MKHWQNSLYNHGFPYMYIEIPDIKCMSMCCRQMIFMGFFVCFLILPWKAQFRLCLFSYHPEHAYCLLPPPTTGVEVHFQHYSDVIVGMMASQITSLTIVYTTVYSAADQRKHQSSASLAFVRGIHR